MLSVTSETATVAGWLSVLVKNFGDARRYYTVARDLARDADDSPRLAFALGGSSSLYSCISAGDDPACAITLLQEANAVSSGLAPSHLRSWLHARLAEELALRGDLSRCASELDRASAMLASACEPADGVFVCCSPAWLDGFRGDCALLLGDYATASTILEETLAADLTLTSQRSAVMTDLGVACARLGELEESAKLVGAE
jgi:hypothetical protein